MEANYYPQQTDYYNNGYLNSLPPVNEEKYSNIKIIDQTPIQYKDSPFDSKKRQRKNVKEENGVTSLFKEYDPNSDYSIELSENVNKNRKVDEVISLDIPKPYYTTNRNYKKLKTQPNFQPKLQFNKAQNTKYEYKTNPINEINQINNNNIIQQNNPEEIIYTNNNIIDYNQIPQENELNNHQNQNYEYNVEYNNIRIPNNPQKRYRSPDAYINNTKKIEDPINTKEKKHHHHKYRKIKVQIIKTHPYYVKEEFENKVSLNSLKNVSFNNKNIQTKNFQNNNKNKNSYDNYKEVIDPKLLEQFKYIKNMESNRKIKELEKEKEKLSRENYKLSKNLVNFSKEKENFEKEKQKFLESKERVINITRKNEERLIKLENELQEKYMKKKNEIEQMRRKLKEEQNNLEKERNINRITFQERLSKLETDYKIKEENQNYNNNLNIEKTKKEQEILRQKEKVINDLKNNFQVRENNLKLKENELRNKEIDLQNKENELNNKFKDLMKKEKNLMDEKEKFLNSTQENEKDFNMKSQELRNREEQLLNKENQLMNRENELKNKENEIQNKQNIINNQENELNNKQNELVNQQNELYNQQNELFNQQNEINNKEKQIDMLNKEIQDKQNQIIELNNTFNNMISNRSSPKTKNNENMDNMNINSPTDVQVETRPSITVKKIQRNFGKKVEPTNINNDNNYKPSTFYHKMETFGPIKDSTKSNKNKDIKDNDDYPENNLKDISDNDDYPENNLNDIKDNDNYPENYQNDVNDNDDYPENNLNDIQDNDNYPENYQKDNYDNDDYPENNLNDIKDNDNYPENFQNDIQDNDNFPENYQNDIQDNDNFPENKIHNIQNNDIYPEKHEGEILNNNMNNNMNNNIVNNINNNISNNMNNKMINNPPLQNQFNDDEEFYGENPNDIENKSDNNNNKNENNNKEEYAFEEGANDFEQFINNQSNSQSQIPENDINNNYNENSTNKMKDINLPMKDSQGKEKEINDLDFFDENNNDIVDNQFPDNQLQNKVQNNINNNNNIVKSNNDITGSKNNNLNKNSEENFSLDLSSKNNNIPPDYQSNNNNINKNYISNITNSQGINASNIPKQEIKDSNNINNNNSDNESGEIDLKNLKHEEDFDMNEKNDNNFNNLNGQNNLENDKDKEIDEITEELYIEEYNPSLGLSKIDNPKYMNAVIQCFSHIPDITDKIINLHCDSNFKDNLSNLKLTKRYRNLLINTFFPEKVYNMNKEAYNPNLLRDTLYELNPLFQNNENIELKEFINYLILKLHDELNTKKNNNINDDYGENSNKKIEMKNESDVLVDFLQNFTTKNHSFISKALYGITKYTFYCHQCQNSFYNFQCYSYLYFNLDKIKEYKQSRYHREDVEISLNDCLDYYQKSETLTGDKGLFCPSCSEQTESTSIKNIYSTKNVLIIILDRNIGNNFNQCNIQFKENLNLRDYVQYKKEGEKNREKFFLGGIVNYIGDNYGNETYNAFIKMGKNNEWYCYDNENVYPVSFQDIQNNGFPIVLFYHKLTQK